MGADLERKELPRLCARAPKMPLRPAVFGDAPIPSRRQAASEHRGEGEPELERRSAPSHPQGIMRERSECTRRAGRRFVV